MAFGSKSGIGPRPPVFTGQDVRSTQTGSLGKQLPPAGSTKTSTFSSGAFSQLPPASSLSTAPSSSRLTSSTPSLRPKVIPRTDGDPRAHILFKAAQTRTPPQ